MVVEGVEHNLDGIVVEDVFPPRQPGTQFSGIGIETNEDRVEIFFVVPEINVGALGGGLTITRNSLGETGYPRHFSAPKIAWPHAEEVIELWRTAKAGNDNVAEFRFGGGKTAAGYQPQHRQHQRRRTTG